MRLRLLLHLRCKERLLVRVVLGARGLVHSQLIRMHRTSRPTTARSARSLMLIHDLAAILHVFVELGDVDLGHLEFVGADVGYHVDSHHFVGVGGVAHDYPMLPLILLRPLANPEILMIQMIHVCAFLA